MNSPPHDASLPTRVLFVATVGLMAIAFVSAVFFASKRARNGARDTLVAAMALGAWLGATALLAQRGALIYEGSGPPPLGPMVLVAAAATGVIAFSPLGARMLDAIPMAALVGFQAFRISVEITLDALYRQGIAPVQMTFEGLNFDVVSGLSALAVAFLASRGRLPRWGLVVWNVGALALLLAIAVIANTSTPGPLRLFHNEPANTVILTAPFVWLPAFLVPCALLGHLLVFRALRRGALMHRAGRAH